MTKTVRKQRDRFGRFSLVLTGRPMKAILCSGFLALAIMALAVPADAGSYEDGLAAYNQGDYATALRLWRPLAEQGHAEAQFNLGLVYGMGQGVPQDDAEAVKWFRMAAEQGIAEAQNNLGSMYYDGRGVPQDDTEAVKWYRKAAEQGDAEAQTNLGAMLATGRGVAQDYVSAHMWFSLAAAKGHEKAKQSQDLAASLMTPDQIAEAQRLAREWMAKHQQ